MRREIDPHTNLPALNWNSQPKMEAEISLEQTASVGKSHFVSQQFPKKCFTAKPVNA